MRTNLPITNIEHKLPDGEFIVSKTDLAGRIIYANRPFIEISGYSEEELIGQHHNLIRHPHMPAAAFADMWRTLKAGRAWSGMVKNRCKNGGFYWVQANANPIWEGNEIVGFMSMRTQLSPENIEVAEHLYQQIREGKANHLKIKDGKAVRKGIAGWLDNLKNLALKQQFAIIAVLQALLLIMVNGIAIVPNTLPSWLPTSLTIVALALTALLWNKFSRRLLAPLQRVIRLCQVVASGDVRMRPPEKACVEIGQLMHAINTMNGNLSSIVSDVRVVSEALSGSTQHIYQTSDALSSAANEQAASVEQTAAALEQMSASIKQNSDNANSTNQLAQHAADNSRRSGETVAKTVQAMRQIADNTSIIDDIAYRTNVLALNATIESARAGEQGKGFAVVAQQVSKLADQSQCAAQESSEVAKSSVEQAQSAGQLLKQLVPAINRTADLVDDIANACQEQALGITQVNQAMEQFNSVTQQNASSSEELSATAAHLQQQSAQLFKAVGVFTQ